jgi:hypothetical protein
MYDAIFSTPVAGAMYDSCDVAFRWIVDHEERNLLAHRTRIEIYPSGKMETYPFRYREKTKLDELTPLDMHNLNAMLLIAKELRQNPIRGVAEQLSVVVGNMVFSNSGVRRIMLPGQEKR